MKYRSLLATLVLALSFALGACDFNGGVEQGRCVGFDPNNKTVTLVVDTTLDQHNPHYSGKVDTFKLPEEARDMGPVPAAGHLLMIEPEKNAILYYDPATKSVKELSVKFTNIEKDVYAKSSKLKGKTFPIIDKAANTITVYSARLEELATFQVKPEEMALPEDTWKLGDEVRIAFRNDKRTQAIRLMNVSKTNIFTR